MRALVLSGFASLIASLKRDFWKSGNNLGKAFCKTSDDGASRVPPERKRWWALRELLFAES